MSLLDTLRRWWIVHPGDWKDDLTGQRDKSDAVEQQQWLQEQTEILQRELDAMRAEAEGAMRHTRDGR